MEFIIAGQRGQSSHTDRQTEEDLHCRISPHAGLLKFLPFWGHIKLYPRHIPFHGQSPHK